jgi:hypothetical protein
MCKGQFISVVNLSSGITLLNSESNAPGLATLAPQPHFVGRDFLNELIKAYADQTD